MRHGESPVTTNLEAEITGLTEKLHFLQTPRIEISGTDIRRRVGNGMQFRYFVPEKIYHYILNHKLYQS
jgi:nicotinate-nucleotide adenylyltransferase